MGNYYKTGIFILTCFFFSSCSKSDADFPDASKNPVSATKTAVTDTSKSATATTPTATTPKPAAPTTPKPPPTTPKPTTPTIAKGIVYKLSVPLNLNGAHDLTISGDSINGGSVACISLYNCTNIHITKCKLVNASGLNGVGINMNKCTNILIDSNYIGNVATGVYAYQSQTIQVKSNQMKNMTGPLWRGQFVQFNSVTGGGNVVGYNKCENIQGESNCEDGISIYNSSGLSTDPINIIGNWLRGGGPSTTGSGITLGDQGGSYIVAQNNIIVNTGYIGMHVAGGTNIQMLNNTIYSGAFAWSHLGLGSGNYSGKVSSNITISGNKVNWNPINIYYQAGSVMPTGWGTNVSNAAISASVLPTTLIDFH